MKKIIFLILLLTAHYSILTAQNVSLPLGGAKFYWISDSNRVRLNQELLLSLGLKVYGTATMNGTLSMSGSNGILLNTGNISLLNGGNVGVANGGSFLIDGVSLTALFPLLSDTNLFWRKTTFDSLFATKPTFNGLATFNGAVLLDTIASTGSFLTMFVDGTNGIDIDNTHIRIAARDKVDLVTYYIVRAQIDDDSNMVKTDYVEGLNKRVQINNAGRVKTDSLIATKYYSGTTTGSAKINVAGDTLFKFRSSLFNDSSYFMMQTNPFTGSTTLKLFGKTGNNMLTLDSAGITTSLPITSTSLSTNTLSGGMYSLWVEGASGQHIGLRNKFIMSSATDGKIKLLNYAGNSFTSLTFGLETSAFPMLLRRSNGLALKGGDTASYMDLQLKKLRADTVSASVIDSAGSLYATRNWVKNQSPYSNIQTSYTTGDTITTASVYVRYQSGGYLDVIHLRAGIQAGWQGIFVNTDATKTYDVDFSGVATLIDGSNFYTINPQTTIKLFYDGTYIIIESEKTL